MERLTKSNRCIVGEGPLWDEITKTLLFVDISGKSFFKMNYETGEIQKIKIPKALIFKALGTFNFGAGDRT